MVDVDQGWGVLDQLKSLGESEEQCSITVDRLDTGIHPTAPAESEIAADSHSMNTDNVNVIVNIHIS